MAQKNPLFRFVCYFIFVHHHASSILHVLLNKVFLSFLKTILLFWFVETLVSNKYKVFKLYLLEHVLNSFQSPLLFLPKIILQEKEEEIRRRRKMGEKKRSPSFT
jgi:hypothetical protein